MEGWIKVHRSIKKHWIFKDAEKLRAWLLILLEVNHEPNKVNVGNLLLTCKRGESLKSLDTWAKTFGGNWNKSKVRRFFKLLQNDSMIVLKSERKTTRLTVCNYDTYQEKRNANETKMKRKRHANDTQTTPNKNEKNEKNEKNNNIPEFTEFKNYVLENEPNIELKALELKYKSWIENNWKDGNNKPIKNWKSKILNTIQYLPKTKDEQQPNKVNLSKLKL